MWGSMLSLWQTAWNVAPCAFLCRVTEWSHGCLLCKCGNSIQDRLLLSMWIMRWLQALNAVRFPWIALDAAPMQWRKWCCNGHKTAGACILPAGMWYWFLCSMRTPHLGQGGTMTTIQPQTLLSSTKAHYQLIKDGIMVTAEVTHTMKGT